MQKTITRGRIVEFVHPQNAERLAALVVRVLNEETGLVHLIAFNDVEEALYGIPAHTVRKPGVSIEGHVAAYHEEGLPGHWTWPEIVAEADETESAEADDETHDSAGMAFGDSETAGDGEQEQEQEQEVAPAPRTSSRKRSSK